MRRHHLVLLVLTLIMLPFMTVSGQETGDTLLVATGADVITFNPVFATDGGSQEATAYLWPLPFEVDPVSGLPIPGLTSWTISEDGLTYTFTIRDDAVWSDGTPITAADAKFTYDAFGAEVVASPKQSQARALGTVNVIDDKTFEVILDKVNCGIWGLMANMRWIPAHKFQPDFSDISTNPINTTPDISGGPYILDEHFPDEFQRYRANPNYWAGKPKIPQLVVRVMPEPGVRIQALQAGDVDYAALSPDQYEQLGATDSFNVASFPDYEILVLIMNHADPSDPRPAYDENGNPVEQTPHPIFGDVRVRRAVVNGYDKSAVLEVLNGAGTLTAASIVPTIGWAYNQELTPWAYDPEAAASLLDEAGWALNSDTGIRQKNGAPLSFELIVSSFRPTYEPTALVAQDQLSQLGMDIKLTRLEFGAFVEQLVAQTYDMAVVSFGDFPPPDPNGITGLFLDSHNDIPGAGFNVASYVNPRMDSLIAEGLAVPGCAPEARAPIYHEIQRLTQEDVAYDFVLASNTFYVMNKRVQGYDPGPWNPFWNIQEWTLGGS